MATRDKLVSNDNLVKLKELTDRLIEHDAKIRDNETKYRKIINEISDIIECEYGSDVNSNNLICDKIKKVLNKVKIGK